MAEIVNLRRARKSRQRSEKAAVADRNRAAYGRSTDERTAERAAAEKASRLLDGHRRDPAPGVSEPDRTDE